MKQIKLKENHLKKESFNSYIRQYLALLGINKIESFIDKPEDSDEESAFNLINMDKAINTTFNKLKDGGKIFVQVD